MSENADRPRGGRTGEWRAVWRRSPLLRRGVFAAAVVLLCFLWAMPVAGLAFGLVDRGVKHWWLMLVFGMLMPVAIAAALRGVLLVSRRADRARSGAAPGRAVASAGPAGTASGAAGPGPSDGAATPPLLPIEPLSPRETEVLRHLATGLSNREIAGSLYVAPGTVKAHLNHIFRKLQAANRLQAVAHARRAGLLDEAQDRE